MTSQTQDKPNGPAAAVVLAAGIGAFVLGLMVTLAEMSADFASFLDFSKNYGLGSGVGPLSGKVIIASAAFFLSWIGFGYAWRRRDVNFPIMFLVAMILLGLGFALTFPPVFDLFAPAG
jgi:hypothetical protein